MSPTDPPSTAAGDAPARAVDRLLLLSDFDRPSVPALARVYGVTPSTRWLAAVAGDAARGRVLDLRMGCGVFAVRAARAGASVVATDVNERAAAFAARGARLNGVEDRVTVVTGDGMAPVPPGAFDVILANLPYVVAPAPEYGYMHSGRAREPRDPGHRGARARLARAFRANSRGGGGRLRRPRSGWARAADVPRPRRRPDRDRAHARRRRVVVGRRHGALAERPCRSRPPSRSRRPAVLVACDGVRSLGELIPPGDGTVAEEVQGLVRSHLVEVV